MRVALFRFLPPTWPRSYTSPALLLLLLPLRFLRYRYRYRCLRRRRRPPRRFAARAVYSTGIARASPLAVDARHKEAEDETVEGDRILSYANIG